MSPPGRARCDGPEAPCGSPLLFPTGWGDGSEMTDGTEQLLDALKAAHRRLDAEIEELRASPAADQLALARLKKRKLQLRDEIARASDLLIPDLIA